MVTFAPGINSNQTQKCRVFVFPASLFLTEVALFECLYIYICTTKYIYIYIYISVLYILLYVYIIKWSHNLLDMVIPQS